MDTNSFISRLKHTAFVTGVSNRMIDGIVKYRERRSVDSRKARRQQLVYIDALKVCGWKVRGLGVEHGCPDWHFPKDTFKIFIGRKGEILRVNARMRLNVRQKEVGYVDPRLKRKYDSIPTVTVSGPNAYLEFGDVLQLDDFVVVVGISSRTTVEGYLFLRNALEPLGFQVYMTEVKDRLHLDMCAGQIARRRVMIDPAAVGASVFDTLEYRVSETPDGEGAAASVVFLQNGNGAQLIMGAGRPEAAELVRSFGTYVHVVELDQFEDRDAGAPCLSSCVN